MKRMLKAMKAMVAVAMVAVSFASMAETEVVDGITWTYTVTGDEVQIGDGSNAAIPTDTAGAVVIPSELGGKPVTSLGYKSFLGCGAMTSLTIPDTVTTFGYAMSGCDGLTSIAIPHSVTNISSQEAFQSNANLENIYVDPANEYYKSEGGLLLTKDGKDLLSVPRKRTTLTVPAGVTRIRRCAVGQMYDLASIDLGSVEILDQSSIFICAALKDVAIPATVTNIGAQAFYSCTQITNLEVAAENPAYKSVDGMVLTKDGKTLVLSSFAKESLTIPEGVETLAAYSVAQCNKITELTIPDGVKEIGRSALYGCSMLVDLKIPGSVTNIGNEAFNVCSSLKRIVLPNGLKSIGTYAFFNNRNVLDTIFIPPSLESFGANSLGSVAAALTVYYNVDDDEGRVRSLVEGAGYAGEATYVPIEGIPGEPVTVTFDAAGGICAEETRTIGLGNMLGSLPDATLDGWVFGGWYSEPNGVGEPVMKSAVVMEPFTCHAYWIEDDGIDWKYRVVNGEAEISNSGSAAIPTDTAGAVRIPSIIDGYTVTSIGYNAFHNCTAMTSVTIPFGVTTISGSAFYGCNGLTEIHLPRTVSSIRAESFCFAKNIASITVDPANVTYKSIDGVVYTKDGKILVTVPPAKTEITIPDTVEEIGYEAFRFSTCNFVAIPQSVRSISSLAFYSSAISSVAIPGSVTNIASSAFYSCSLVSATIQPGEEPVTIGERAFRYDSTLESVSIPTNVVSIGVDAFADTALATVYYSTNDTEERVRALVEGSGYGAVTYVQNDNPPVPKRTVTFNANGGTCSEASRDVEVGAAVGELPVPELEGWTFNGWWTQTSGGKPLSAETIVTAKATWYAHWTQTKEVATEVVDGVAWTYRIFNDKAIIYNNGNAAVSPMPDGEVTIPAVLGGCPVTEIDEYAFCNCTGMTGVKIPVGVTTVRQNAFYLCSSLEDVKLPYGFTFIAFGGFCNSGLKSIAIPETVTTIGNQAFAATALKTVYVETGDVERVQYVFATGSNPFGGLVFEEIKFICTVAFDGNGGTPGAASMIVTNELAYGELPGATREDCSLIGWFTAAEGGTQVTADTIFSLYADQTLYAHWTALVTLDTNGGTPGAIGAQKPIGMAIGTWIGWQPTRNGYTHNGWWTAREGGEQVTAETVITGPVRFYAHWTANEYTASFDANGGSCEVRGKDVTFDAAYGELPVPTLAGYTFDGWWTLVDGGELVTAETIVSIADDHTLYAHWAKNTVKPGEDAQLTFDDIGYTPPEGEGFTYTFKGLPAGLKYDSKSGKITGKATKPGEYEVTVTAKNGANPKGIVGTITMTVANFTDDEIPVEDSYGPYIPGVGYVETIDAAAGCKASGLPTGMKWTEKAVTDKALGAVPANSFYGAAAKPGKYTVTFTKTVNKVKHTASATIVVGPFPKLTIEVFGSGTGKVTGAGEYAAGKKVTLKATADTKDAAATDTKPATVKSVFNGFYDGDMLLTQSPSFSLEMPSTDTTIRAHFVTAAEDLYLSATVGDFAFNMDDTSADVSIPAGVYLEWPVAVEAMSLPTVKVAGLPAGLKFTAKDIVDSKTKAVIVPANTIYGAPTAASKKDKFGNTTPSSVKVTVTTAGKTKAEYTIAVTVTALPEWAVGTFDGEVLDVSSGEPVSRGIVSLSVTAAGKISGKWTDRASSAAFKLSADSFASVQYPALGSPAYVATVIGQAGKALITNEVVIVAEPVVAPNGADMSRGVATFSNSAIEITGEAYQNLWKADPWKGTMDALVKILPSPYEETIVYHDPYGDRETTVTLKFAASGAVTAKADFLVGEGMKKYSASCSSVFVPNNYGSGLIGVVNLVFPANAGKGFAGWSGSIRIEN